MKSRAILIMTVIILSWSGLVVAGFVWLGRYEFEPARATAAPVVWPQESAVELAQDRPTLLMFVHPQCPCTRASIQELARLVARCEGRAKVMALFYRPPGAGEEWSQTDLWRSAAAIPGVTVVPDEDGVEARRFHGETSGQTLLYDSQGHLIFAGGITISRGHEGDNAGRSALMAILNEGDARQANTPVFGCSLVNPDPLCKATSSTPRP